MIKKCLKCNKKFSKRVFCSKKEWSNRLYCSRSCANSINSIGTKRCVGRVPWNKGLKCLSGKENIRYSRVDKNCKICDKQFTVKNYRKEIALYCSKKCKTDDNLGLTTDNERLRRSKEYKMWRELVYERDNYSCQKCLIKGCNLNAHHIINFSENKELRLNIDNGVTFCRECHYIFHSEYGFNKNSKEQVDNFLSAGQE